jgi:hypothetical protein
MFNWPLCQSAVAKFDDCLMTVMEWQFRREVVNSGCSWSISIFMVESQTWRWFRMRNEHYCDFVLCGRYVLAFRRNVLPPSLGGRKRYEDLKSDIVILYGEATLRNVCRFRWVKWREVAGWWDREFSCQLSVGSQPVKVGVKWPPAWDSVELSVDRSSAGATVTEDLSVGNRKISLGRSRCQETASGDCNILRIRVCVCQWTVKCTSSNPMHTPETLGLILLIL